MISLENLTIGFRGPSLLEDVSCKIEPQQRIGLLGRNGAGKTTLLRILAGETEPDHGEVLYQPNTRIAFLQQDVPRNVAGRVTDLVAADVRHGETGEPLEPWEIDHRVESTLARIGLDGDLEFATLSSGMKRRALLARALAIDPHVLLLDEPTNHLDITSILWLEDFLSRWQGTLIFITHDRSFLRTLANRIWEIDRGRLFDWSCDYDTFLKRKEEALAAEEKQNALFDKRLAEEEAWIRQGIKARRTRNEGRVRALKAMRDERQQRRTSPGTAKLQIQEAMRSGALVADVKDISFAYEDHPIVEDFSTTIMRGDKIGIIGPNGAGKTTLLRLLLGKLEPDSGSVRIGTNVEIAYFDQLREQLDPNKTVLDNVVDGTDRVTVGGKTKHIIGYLQDFLFAPERARTEVRFLSGGERNRVLLARLMTKPANVLVLDEPTNDLDSETLELLEEQVIQFAGTVLLVSHDRTFLNNVVTSTIVFEEDGVHEYVGGYDDWRRTIEAKQAA
ncbi:MAG: ATP-binding cassette domain-containing protein, partial [Pirellulaceae bacterium]